MSGEPIYEIVSPIGDELKDGASRFAPAAALADLAGRKIGLVWTEFTNGDVLLDAFEALLARRYPSLRFVKLPPGRNAAWGGSPDPTLSQLVRDHGIDAAIVTAGC